NCADADVVIVHALFHRLRELSREDTFPGWPRSGFLRRFHRRFYYGFLAGLEGRLYSDPTVALVGVSPRTAGLLEKYFHRHDVRVIPNGVDSFEFSPATRLALRAEARRLRHFREGDFVLLLVGNDWANKGLPTILEAMQKLPEVPSRLLIVGN